MANELTKTYQASDGQEVTLNPSIIANWILGGNTANVPESEYARVIMTCAARGLNPLAGDVAVQPHWNKRKNCNELSLVMTKDYFQRRAESNPKYDGKEYGIVVLSADGRPVRREGCGIYPELGEQLLSGWCRVHVKGHSVPEYAEASFSEYNTGMSLWLSKPATMIAKVAKSQALREAFPNEFQGLYEPEEIGMAINDNGEPIEATVTIETPQGDVSVPVYGPEGWSEMGDGERWEYIEKTAKVPLPTAVEEEGWEPL